MDVLIGRDTRVRMIQQLLSQNKVILSIRANYPGERKDNPITRKIIKILHEQIRLIFSPIDRYFLNCGEGYVYLYVLNSDEALKVKEQSILLEEGHPLGRFVDLDIYYQNDQSISRKNLNIPGRTCFLCDQDAFICMRNKTHSLEELITKIKKAVEEYERHFS